MGIIFCNPTLNPANLLSPDPHLTPREIFLSHEHFSGLIIAPGRSFHGVTASRRDQFLENRRPPAIFSCSQRLLSRVLAFAFAMLEVWDTRGFDIPSGRQEACSPVHLTRVGLSVLRDADKLVATQCQTGVQAQISLRIHDQCAIPTGARCFMRQPMYDDLSDCST